MDSLRITHNISCKILAIIIIDFLLDIVDRCLLCWKLARKTTTQENRGPGGSKTNILIEPCLSWPLVAYKGGCGLFFLVADAGRAFTRPSSVFSEKKWPYDVTDLSCCTQTPRASRRIWSKLSWFTFVSSNSRRNLSGSCAKADLALLIRVTGFP